MKPTLKAETISAVILLALTGYFGYDFYLDYRQGVSRVQTEFNDAQHTHEVRMKLAGSLQEADAVRARLAPEATSEWLLDHVSGLAKSTGIEITSAIPYPPRQVDQFIQPSVALQISTSYHQLGKFLSVLESAEPFVRVDEMDISRGGSAEEPATVRLTLSTVYTPAVSL